MPCNEPLIDLLDSVTLTTDQATALINSGIHFAADDFVTVQVNTDAEGTQFSSSLKDLQKLGVDVISVAAGVDQVTLNADGAQLSNAMQRFLLR